MAQFAIVLGRAEGKTLEFKENTRPFSQIVKTVIAFANTAGGMLVIGVSDRDKRVVGISNVLAEEERLANVIATSIEPMILPEIEIQALLDRDLLVVHVCRGVGPYRVKGSRGCDGVYARLGSTNRMVDYAYLDELERAARNIGFDELPCQKQAADVLDHEYLKKHFQKKGKSWNLKKAETLGIVAADQNQLRATNGGILICSPLRETIFPEARLRCVRFAGDNRAKALDHQDFSDHFIERVEKALTFVRRNTRMAAKFGELYREDIPEYPTEAVREALLNAIIHADYSQPGTSVQVAIFDDRMEITSPGCLPFGFTLDRALSGASRPRNRVIARFFHELGLIEQWGSGIGRIQRQCTERKLRAPCFEEIGTFFRVTLYNSSETLSPRDPWEEDLVDHLNRQGHVTLKETADLWGVTSRTSHNRLKQLEKRSLIIRIASSPKDRQAVYVLKS